MDLKHKPNRAFCPFSEVRCKDSSGISTINVDKGSSQRGIRKERKDGPIDGGMDRSMMKMQIN